MKPYIASTGLTPGSTVFLRYWGTSTTSGNFGLCVSSPTNDDCTNALYICDLNGYSSSTSAAYTADRPSNMRGNAEVSGTYAYTPGTNTGGIFGSGGAWGTGSPAYDVQIDNNSWIKFTAAATSATLGVTISNCWVGNYPSGGIQMQIFSGTNCTNFTPVSSFKENSTGFTITANGLTVGQTYYLMVDGYANDICNYTITAQSGVLFPAITASQPTICKDASTTLTAPIGATSYSWSPGGETSQTISVSPTTTTTYTCVVGGVCGYTQTLTKVITVNQLPVIQVNSGNPASVCGNQSITLTASGATSYSWSTSQSTASITVSPTTNTSYTVTGTDANSCSSSFVVPVTFKPLPTITVNDPTICFNQTAVLTANGASTTSSYTWSNGTTSTNTINVSPGTLTSYTVTGTAANGCINTDVATVTVNSLPTISVNSATICNNQTAILTASGAASTTNYSWSNGTNNINTISVSPSSLSTYTVTGTASNTCSNTAVATVTVNSLPNILVNSGTICNGQSITLTATGGNTYSWNTTATGPSINVNPSSVTSYTVTGVDNNSCSNSAVATVNVNNIPTLSTAPTITPSNCGQSTGAITGAVVSGNGTLLYSWTNSSNTVVGTTADISNKPAGVYNLTVTDGNSCNALFGPFSITNPGAPVSPTVTSPSDTIVCVGEQIILNASSTAPNPTYNWTGPNANSNSSTLAISNATSADAGIYTITVTSAGCTSPPTLVNVIVNSLPLANATNTGSPYCSDSTITLIASGGNGYSWTGPAGFTSTTQSPAITNAAIAMNGTYTVTVTDNNGCVATATASIVVNQTPAPPIASADASNYCEGQNILLSSNSTGATAYSWSGPNGFSSGLQNPTINNSVTLQSGTYTVYATSSGCNSSNASVNLTVNSNPVATASINATTICSGTTINLSSGGGTGYSWTGPAGYTSGQQNAVISNSATTNSGLYIVTVTNTAGCTDSASVSVLVNQTPGAPQVSGDTTCVGGTLILTASGAGNFDWYSDAALTNLVLADSNQYSPNIPINSSAIYYVTSTSNGCTSTVSSANAVNYNVIASASANPYTGFIPLNVQFTNLSTGVDASDNFEWTVNNTTFSNSFNSSYAFTNNGNYVVSLIVIDNQSGCTDTTTLNIFADGLVTFTIPNIFTPNDDDENDEFVIISHGLKEVTVAIYDRWGLKMYEIEGVKASWDGRTTSGLEVPDGTYFYLFRGVGLDDKEYKQNGHLMIMR